MKYILLTILLIMNLQGTEVFPEATESEIQKSIQENIKLIASGDFKAASMYYIQADLDGLRDALLVGAGKGIEKGKIDELEKVFGPGVTTLEKVKALNGQEMMGKILEFVTNSNPMMKDAFSTMKSRIIGVIKTEEGTGYAVVEIHITVNGVENTAIDVVPVKHFDVWKIGLKADFKKLANSISTMLTK